MHMIAVSLFSGVHLVCEEKFDVDGAVETMKREGTTIWFGVPAMIILLGDRHRKAVTGTQLRAILHSGAVVSDGALKAMRTAFPDAASINLYSLTESGAGIVSSTAADALEAPGTVGRPLPTTQVRIVGPDGARCGPDELGELLFKSPYMLDGFYRDGAVVPPELEDGWLRSGDGGSIDAAGRIFLAGRLTDVIIRGGYNVHPVAVEATILEFQDVTDVAVVPVPHRVLGEDIAAVVVAHAPFELEALQAHCRRWLANYEIPREIFFVEELPRNEFGKLKRRDIVELVRGLMGAVHASR
jgi:long-chain acyl-CoA synthetase